MEIMIWVSSKKYEYGCPLGESTAQFGFGKRFDGSGRPTIWVKIWKYLCFFLNRFFTLLFFLLLIVVAFKDYNCYANQLGTVFYMRNVKNDFSGTRSDVGLTINITSRNIRVQPQLKDCSFINTKKWSTLYKYNILF